MYILTPVLTLILHHLFQYVNLLLEVVNVTLVIWCLIVCLGFDVLDLVLQICHYPLISVISNYLGPFILVVIIFWNGCIIASSGCILAYFSLFNALLFHFYLLASCRWGFSCSWLLINILLLAALLFAWAMAQPTSPSGHDSGGGEFTIGSFIKWHILRANQRWWIDGIRLLIGQLF